MAQAADEVRFFELLLDELAAAPPASKQELHRAKVRIARSTGLRGIRSDSEVLARVPVDGRRPLEEVLRVKPTRTASGVAVVTVMTAPHACPHGVCVYCPGGPRFHTPQSYTGTEPAARRAAEHRYDPHAQVVSRVRGLQEIGHHTDKVDLLIIGGTFTSTEAGY